MNPTRLRARAFRTWDELDLELPQGVTAIVGENGAGKSSLLTLIDVCLFGGRGLADHYQADADGDLMQLQIDFDHHGHRYRVRRTYSPRGRGTTKVDFERWAVRCNIDGTGPVDFPDVTGTEGDWQPLTRETAAATQELLEQTLGLSRDTFRASAFLAQGDGAAFTEASPRDRKAILADILDLSLWDRLAQAAKDERAALDIELAAVAARVERAEDELEQRDTVVAGRAQHEQDRDRYAAALAGLERQLSDVDAQLAAGREALAALDATEKLARQLADQAATIDDRIGALTDEDVAIQEQLADRDGFAAQAALVAELEDAAETRAKLAAVEEAVADCGRRCDKLLAEIGQLEERKLSIDRAEHPRCPTCEQTLDMAATATAFANLQAQTDVLAADHERESDTHYTLSLEAAELGLALGEWADTDPRPALANARAARELLASLDAKAERLPEIRAQIDTLSADRERVLADLAGARARAAELAERGPHADAAQEAEQLRNRIATDRERVSWLDRQIARADAQLERLDEIAATAQQDHDRASEIVDRADTLRTLERAYGRDGIPALILENTALPQIETDTNRILAELDTSYRVELRTQRALKTGDGHRDVLDIVVTDQGRERLYETFSGGERTRLNLALRISLARLLAHSRGADVRLLALDEPEFLDEHGMDALARVLQGLTGDFDRILVVSHVPALREAFDQAIEIVKTDGRSHLVAAREEVAA